MSSEPRRASIAVIGAGPRGTSLIERIGASLPPHAAIELHVIDDAQSGAGRIWRTDQDRELCMNTLADAVTLFTEPGASVSGPVHEGPTLYEWCLLAFATDGSDGSAGALSSGDSGAPGSAALVVGPDPDRRERLASIPAARRSAFDAFPVRRGLAADYTVELAALRPESHPSRALYGEYLSWCFDRAVSTLPAGVRMIRHRSRAMGVERLERPDGGPAEAVALADGDTVRADAVVIATGWMPRTPTESERGIEQHLASHPAFVWVRPGSPVEQELDSVPDGAQAIVRGLGMGFFDATALLTIGRGGRFVPDPTAPGGLRYEASGREPVLHVTSRRGVPFRAKTLYGSLPPRTDQRFLRAVDWDAVPRPIDFDRLIWPRVVADAYTDFATTLHRVRPEAVAGGLPDLLAAIARELDALLDAAPADPDAEAADLDVAPARMDAILARWIPDAADRFDLLAEMHPAHERFASAAGFDAWVRRRVADDLREAELGVDSAVKAGLWSVSTARGAVSRIGTMGGFDAESRGNGYRTVMAVGALAGSGPPAFRNRQLLALAEAGIVRFIGPAARLVLDERGFTTMSPAVAGAEVSAPVLIDAWMHFHDVSATADPLAISLLAAGRARPFAVRARSGREIPTAGFDVDAADGRIVRADGAPDPVVHIAGIPVDDALHDTIISPMPGTDPPMLRETDRVARSAIRVALSAAEADIGAGADAAVGTANTTATATATAEGVAHD